MSAGLPVAPITNYGIALVVVRTRVCEKEK